MRAEIHGARIFVTAETKQDLTDMKRVLNNFPEANNYYFLVLDSTEVDTSCDVRPISEEQKHD